MIAPVWVAILFVTFFTILSGVLYYRDKQLTADIALRQQYIAAHGCKGVGYVVSGGMTHRIFACDDGQQYIFSDLPVNHD